MVSDGRSYFVVWNDVEGFHDLVWTWQRNNDWMWADDGVDGHHRTHFIDDELRILHQHTQYSHTHTHPRTHTHTHTHNNVRCRQSPDGDTSRQRAAGVIQLLTVAGITLYKTFSLFTLANAVWKLTRSLPRRHFCQYRNTVSARHQIKFQKFGTCAAPGSCNVRIIRSVVWAGVYVKSPPRPLNFV